MTSILLAMDYMVGIADQSYAKIAAIQADKAVTEARKNGIPVVFTKVGFRPGHPEVSANNKIFGTLLGTDKLVGKSSALVAPFNAQNNEPVLDKTRFSAFAGSGLWTIIRASGAKSVVLCGLSTSGVVLSTALELIDADYRVVILSDACADPEADIQDVVLNKILAPRATVCSFDSWATSLAKHEGPAS